MRQADRVTERQNDSMTVCRAAKEPALVLQYFPLNMSIVWNNNIGEIGAKRREYEESAPQ